jgi:hypothetical protein
LDLAQASFSLEHFGGTAWLIFFGALAGLCHFLGIASIYVRSKACKESIQKSRQRTKVKSISVSIPSLLSVDSQEKGSSHGCGLKDSLAVVVCGLDVPHRGVDATLVRHGHQRLDVGGLRGART